MKPIPLIALALVTSATLLAQSRPATDPLTGTWSGYIGRSEATPAGAKAELKLDANGAVSGTVTGPQLSPGEIKAGSFDAKTGALKFSVVIRDNQNADVSFDGRVSNDTASGTMRLGTETGVFRFVKEGRAAGAVKQASRPAGDADAAARRGFVEVSDWITRAAALVPPDKYSYRPVATVRTFGQLVAHVVDGSKYYCSRGAGRNVEWSDATEKGVTTKAALLQALKQATAECAAAHDAPNNQIGPLMANTAHNSLHYGNMVTYIRMLGLVPPSS